MGEARAPWRDVARCNISFWDRQVPVAVFDSWRQYQTDNEGATVRDANGRAVITTGTLDDMLRREAELYLLINRGGVPHADDDLVVARQIIEGTVP